MTLSLAALVAVNLIPLVGVLFFGWVVGPILLLYWSETLVVSGYNVLKIMVRPAEHPIVYLGRLFPIALDIHLHRREHRPKEESQEPWHPSPG